MDITNVELSGLEEDLQALASALLNTRVATRVEPEEVGAVRGYRQRFPMPDDFNDE